MAMGCGVQMQFVPKPEDERWSALVVAIFDQAIFDVRSGYVESFEGEAASWLLSTGLKWLAGLGIDVDQDLWVSWVKAGCPKDWE